MRKPSFYSLIKKTTYGIAVLSILFSILSILYFFPDSAWAHPYLDALNYITGGRPSAVFIDDFDNDGNKDMAVANNITSWNLWILRNNGNGTFSSPTPYGLGTCGGRDVKGADFNSDGNKDLAISCGSAVRVVLGNGDGTFGSPATYDIGPSYTLLGLDISDFNNDTKLDLVVADYDANGVSVLLGNGDGIFGSPSFLSMGGLVYDVVSADFDNDGNTDLASANYSSTVTVRLGSGNGTFYPLTSYSLPMGAVSITTNDFNGDGNKDLAVANMETDSIYVLLGTGTGSFGNATNYSAGDGAYSVFSADLDGDGNKDLAVANSNANTASILLGDGNGSFSLGANYGGFGLSPNSISGADLDNDSKIDLAVANWGSGDISVLISAIPPNTAITSATVSNGGTTTSSSITFNFSGAAGEAPVDHLECSLDGGVYTVCISPQTYSNLSTGVHSFAVRAVDAGGLSDPTPSVWGWTITGSAVPIDYGANTYNTRERPTAVFLGDFNNDGAKDMAVTYAISSGLNFSIFLNNGDGTFGSASNYELCPGRDVKGADFNSDGNKDLAISCGSAVRVVLGNGDGTFGSPATYDIGPSYTLLGLDISDFNNDTKLDLVVADYDANGVSVLLGNGDGIFGSPSFLSMGGLVYDVVSADFDNDGNTDLASANYSSTVTVRLGSGNGTFYPLTSYSLPMGAVSITTNDFNGDGNKDLAVANMETDSIYVLLGTGTGSFGNATNYSAGDGAYSVFSADLDGDGNKDLAAANYYSNTASIFVGAGDGTFSLDSTYAVGTNPDYINGADLNNDSIIDLVTANRGSNNVTVLAGVDTVAPNTTITSAPANPSTSSSASFSFTSTETGTFECSLDGGAWEACSSPKSYSGLFEASHSFEVRAIDGAGNTDPSPASYSWTVDLTAPDTTITSSPSNPTNSTSASFSFTSTETGTFECSLDGGAWEACSSPKSYGGLSDGSHAFSVRATDVAGNTDATPASYSWTVDTIAPNTTITSNPANPSNSSSASFEFTSNESGSSFDCSLDGGAWLACSSPNGYSGLSEGSHAFEVRATDNAGNTDPSPASYAWTIDLTPPDTTITSNPGPVTLLNNPATFQFTSTESGSTFECSLDSGAWSVCSSPKTYVGLALGNHTFRVRAIDQAGNIDGSPATHSWTVINL